MAPSPGGWPIEGVWRGEGGAPLGASIREEWGGGGGGGGIEVFNGFKNLLLLDRRIGSGPNRWKDFFFN